MVANWDTVDFEGEGCEGGKRRHPGKVGVFNYAVPDTTIVYEGPGSYHRGGGGGGGIAAPMGRGCRRHAPARFEPTAFLWGAGRHWMLRA